MRNLVARNVVGNYGFQFSLGLGLKIFKKMMMMMTVKSAPEDGDDFFPEKYTVKDHISNTKLEKGDHYYIQTRHNDLFSHFTILF